MQKQNNIDNESMRLDKWLWVSRFFKTRGLATEAISGGKVHLNGGRVKPSRKVKAGDELSITKGEMVFEIDVLGLNKQRRPAKEAQLLYKEKALAKEVRESKALYMKEKRQNNREFSQADKKQKRQVRKTKHIVQ